MVHDKRSAAAATIEQHRHPRRTLRSMLAVGGVYSDHEIDGAIDALLYATRDGRACVYCGNGGGAMVPIGHVDGCQVFAHEDCRRGT